MSTRVSSASQRRHRPRVPRANGGEAVPHLVRNAYGANFRIEHGAPHARRVPRVGFSCMKVDRTVLPAKRDVTTAGKVALHASSAQRVCAVPRAPRRAKAAPPEHTPPTAPAFAPRAPPSQHRHPMPRVARRADATTGTFFPTASAPDAARERHSRRTRACYAPLGTSRPSPEAEPANSVLRAASATPMDSAQRHAPIPAPCTPHRRPDLCPPTTAPARPATIQRTALATRAQVKRTATERRNHARNLGTGNPTWTPTNAACTWTLV